MTWRIQPLQPERRVVGLEALLSVIACHEAWRRLTSRQRAALLSAPKSGYIGDAHHCTRAALIRHGLADDSGYLTPAGHDVVEYRPPPPERETSWP